MTTLVKVHPYTHFYLGKIDDNDVVDIRAADASMATEAGGVVTIAPPTPRHARIWPYALQSFNDTEGGDVQNVTSLASEAAQNAPTAVPSWEAPCTMRAYVSSPEVASDSVKLIRDHTGWWVLYAEHETLGKLVAVVVFGPMSKPFIESGGVYRLLHALERGAAPA